MKTTSDKRGFYKETILFTDGDWHIVRKAIQRPGSVVLARHVCDGERRSLNTGCDSCCYTNGHSDGRITAACWRCHQPMPEGLCALMKMMNWGSECGTI